MLRQRSIDRSRLLSTLLHIEPDQREIGNTVNDHIRDSECVVGVERYYTDVPTYGGRRNDDILAGIQKSSRLVEIDRLRGVGRECENVDREENVFDDSRQEQKVIRDEPVERSGVI